MSEQFTEEDVAAMLKEREARGDPPFVFNRVAIEGLLTKSERQEAWSNAFARIAARHQEGIGFA